MTTLGRMLIAEEIVRRADTVTLLKPEEVSAIYVRALDGEFDDIFKDEEEKEA